jgi:apolipoprotein D and lipocalin family protein
MRFLGLATLSLCAACVVNPVYRTSTAPLQVAAIDQSRYLGHWYEQARLPNSFESNCVRAEAEYALRPDRLISVVNTCQTADGRTRVARGRARAIGAATEGKLQVSFFGPFWADYWVLDRAEDYSWSIVGEGQGRYLWLLTRAERLAPEERRGLEARIAALGYPLQSLVWRDRPPSAGL